MFIVYNAYDDGYADIMDTINHEIRTLSNSEIIEISGKYNIEGVILHNGKIEAIRGNRYIECCSEEEAYRMCGENRGSGEYHYKCKVVYAENGVYAVVQPLNSRIHVNYYVCYYLGDTITFVGKNGGYTNYIQSAKTFDRDKAYKLSAVLTRKSKTGKYWTVLRQPVR